MTDRATRIPRLSVVLSFWNEEDVIPELLRRLRAVLRPLEQAQRIEGYELIFINDASTDGSEALLLEAMKEGDIRLLNMSRNFGTSPCIMAGFAHARGELVVYMDADLQDPPELIPALLDAWREDPAVEVVHTVRSAREGESRVKKGLTWLGYRILHGTSSVDLPIEAGDFKLLTRKVIDQLVALPERRPFIRGLVRWVGYKQARVQYVRQARHAGETKFPVLGPKVIFNFLESALISQSEAPLRLILMAGLGLSTLAVLLAVLVTGQWLLGGMVQGWFMVLIALFLLGGLQTSALGFMGLYLGAVHLETRGRPLYLVREVMGHASWERDGDPEGHDVP